MLTANPSQHIEAIHPGHSDIDKTGEGRRRTAQHVNQRVDQIITTREKAGGMLQPCFTQQPAKKHLIDLFIVHHE
jgi:hypothetical protein